MQCIRSKDAEEIFNPGMLAGGDCGGRGVLCDGGRAATGVAGAGGDVAGGAGCTLGTGVAI